MVSVMNDYVSKIELVTDDVMKSIFQNALLDQQNINKTNVMIRSNHYIVDIKMDNYTVENAINIMNCFMERTRFHYSSFFVRFNEGNLVRYRYASCKENRIGFYCDVIISG